MAQPILTACGFQEPNLPPLTLLKQNSGVDGSFLIASVLGHRLKTSKEHHVLLVATHHTYSHYSAACMKLAYNLGPQRESGQLQVLDVAAELYNGYPDSCPKLDNVFKRVGEFLEAYPRATVLLDDLTYFLNFDHSEGQLIDFVESLVTNRKSEEQAIVIKLNTAELYDTLCANLDDLAQTEVRLEKLSSGNFREVDGRLSVSRCREGDDEALLGVKKLEKSVLYKVNERNIKVFVPGEIGIKNL